MLGKYVNSPARLQGLRDSPLGTALERFAQELCDTQARSTRVSSYNRIWCLWGLNKGGVSG